MKIRLFCGAHHSTAVPIVVYAIWPHAIPADLVAAAAVVVVVVALLHANSSFDSPFAGDSVVVVAATVAAQIACHSAAENRINFHMHFISRTQTKYNTDHVLNLHLVAFDVPYARQNWLH